MGAFRFSIYSTDNNNPDLASDATSWMPDPIGGEYDSRHEWEGRGSYVKTLGGAQIQDYGMNVKDRKIRIVGNDFSEVIKSQIETKYKTLDADWHFTDGLGEVFKVRFRRSPMGLVLALDLQLYARGRHIVNPPLPQYVRYRYEIILLVVSQVV